MRCVDFTTEIAAWINLIFRLADFFIVSFLFDFTIKKRRHCTFDLSVVGTTRFWIRISTEHKNPKITHNIDKKILKALYESDNHANISSEIVKMINDSNCRTHGTANLRIGEFGKRIFDETGIQAPSFRDNGIPWWWNIPFLGWHDEEHRGNYYWQLRPELAVAIKNHSDLLQSGEKLPHLVREPNVWIFQNNPKKSNLTIDEHVSTNKGNWSVRQHDKDIKKGDIVLFWISGKNRGIYSVADILDKPDLTEVNPTWPWVLNKSSKKRRPKELMVDYEGLRKIDPLILESELKKIPELSNLSIINRYRKTNYPVTKSEWEILSKEIEKRKLSESPQIQEDIDSDMDSSEEERRAKEGGSVYYYGKRYERDLKNRLNAIKYHGTQCSVCGFDFSRIYKQRGHGFIEIHHIKPISTYEKEMEVDPKNDLIPVCANCHRMIHRFRDNVLSVDELRKIIN